MSDAELLSLAKTLRARAVEVLVRAEAMIDADARQMMCEIAARYDKLAERLEYESR
jgi:hypothetical protein